MTFSVVARCAETGQLGIAISSSSIAVGARCPWLRPGVGAVRPASSRVERWAGG
mgnify:CR=1 FL=1